MSTAEEAAVPQPVSAPTDWLGTLRHLGPGLIISAVIVGSGELIATPKLGASVGFKLLWFIILGCLVKVFVQIELGRFAVSKGMTTLEAMNIIPGPRYIVSWLVWLWLLMYIALVFQVAGMVGGLASIISLAGIPLGNSIIALLVGASCAILLVVGRYRLVELFSMILVALFTICTMIAVGVLQGTSFAITPAQIMEGLKFQMPDSFTIAFGTFGIIGVGASELIYYPYWCLEKGYGRSIGPRDDSVAWTDRARGWIRVMKIDALVSFVIYTSATLAFYFLGAAILHAKGLTVDDNKMIETLSHMYRETFGQSSYWLFLFGAFCVLYSTVFGATASNARLFADALNLFKIVEYKTHEDRTKMVKLGCVLLPCAFVAVYLFWGAPVSLVFVGAIAQGLMLPFLAIAALYFHYKRTDAVLLPGKIWVGFLWLSTLCMVSVGLYQVVAQIQKLLP
ncbi:MAG: Nramp family divalent metal transporter [Verrucomicrobia bacterium]|nr:Nramp family divalent metal transporter [Verrucomicrobiota bacterium]